MRCTALLVACASVISAREIFIESAESAFFEDDTDSGVSDGPSSAPSSGPSSGPSTGPPRIMDGINCGSNPAICKALDHVTEAFSDAQSQIEKLAAPSPPEDAARVVRAATRGRIQHELQGILIVLNHTGSQGGEWEERELWKQLKDLEENERDGLERAVEDEERKDEDAQDEQELRAERALDDLEFRTDEAEAAIEEAQLDNGEELLKSLKRKQKSAKKGLKKELKKAKRGAKKALKKQQKTVLKQAKKSLKEEYKRFRAGNFEISPTELVIVEFGRIKNFGDFVMVGFVVAVALRSWRRPTAQPNAATEPLLVHLA